MGPNKKFCAKFLIIRLGPFKLIKVKSNNSYDMKREVPGEGLMRSTCIKYIKPWSAVPFDVCSGRPSCGDIVLLSFIFNIRRKC